MYKKYIKPFLMKIFKCEAPWDLDDILKQVNIAFYTTLVGLSEINLGMVFNNIYFTFGGSCVLLIAGLYLAGWASREKQMKDTWKGEKTMEWEKSRQLSDDWESKHKVLEFLQGCYYDWGRTVEIPDDIYRKIKYFIQRGKRGYSDCDVWGFYDYLNNVMVGGLKQLQKNVHGYPCGILGKDDPDSDGEKESEEWKRVLGEIIWLFEVNQKIENHDLLYVEYERNRPSMENYTKRLNSPDKKRSSMFKEIPPHIWTLMTKEECKRYKDGWKLFQKYYFNLWD